MLHKLCAHDKTLRNLNMITDRAPIHCRTKSGFVVEILEWKVRQKVPNEYPPIDWRGHGLLSPLS